MKTISEEYARQLAQLHDEKASFGDAKGLKAIEKWIKQFKPESILDYGCGKGGVVLALKEAIQKLVQLVGIQECQTLIFLITKSLLICLLAQTY